MHFNDNWDGVQRKGRAIAKGGELRKIEPAMPNTEAYEAAEKNMNEADAKKQGKAKKNKAQADKAQADFDRSLARLSARNAKNQKKYQKAAAANPRADISAHGRPVTRADAAARHASKPKRSDGLREPYNY